MSKRRPTPSRRQTAHSNTYRFFVSPETIQEHEAQITDAELIHQISNVLRLGQGDQLVLLDNTGWQYTVRISQTTRQRVSATVENKQHVAGEPRTQLTMYLALMRPERFEWALQKGTELGAVAFVPLISEHSFVSDTRELGERKIERWRKIVREAAEQSRRGKIPQLALPQPFANMHEHVSTHDVTLMLWEGTHAQSLRQALGDVQTTRASADTPLSIGIVSGPEGGFAEEELETARSYGIIPITLGPRTLRAETAPLAAATAIFYQLGDLE